MQVRNRLLYKGNLERDKQRSREQYRSDRRQAYTSDHNANLTSLSQNFLTIMPNIEQKFSSFDSPIRTNCTNPNDAELQAPLKDMVEVIADMGAS